MLKSEFEKIPNGTIFKIPGVRKVFVKAQVYFEEQYLALPYDGRRNILLIKDIPEDIKIEKGDPNLLYVPERDEKNYLEMCEKNNKKLDEIDRIQRENGKLLYRFIQLPYADGYAVYQIVYISGQQVFTLWRVTRQLKSIPGNSPQRNRNFSVKKWKIMLKRKETRHFRRFGKKQKITLNFPRLIILIKKFVSKPLKNLKTKLIHRDI